MRPYRIDVRDIESWIGDAKRNKKDILSQQENLDSEFLKFYITKIDLVIKNLGFLEMNFESYLDGRNCGYGYIHKKKEIDFPDRKIEKYSSETMDTLVKARKKLDRLRDNISREGRYERIAAIKTSADFIDEIIEKIKKYEKMFEMLQENLQSNKLTQPIEEKFQKKSTQLVEENLHTPMQPIEENLQNKSVQLTENNIQYEPVQLNESDSQNQEKTEENAVEEKPIQDVQVEGRKNKTLRQRFDINNEQDMNRLFEFYAQMNVAYYNKKDRTPEEVKMRRNINAQFKRIIDKKANALIENESSKESNFEQKIQEINSGVLFPENEIEEIAKSKGATIKLFQIFASGVYEKDGARIRLSQKQRCALANVLQKVSEKNLEIENAKLEQKGKTNKDISTIANLKEIEKGE